MNSISAVAAHSSMPQMHNPVRAASADAFQKADAAVAEKAPSAGAAKGPAEAARLDAKVTQRLAEDEAKQARDKDKQAAAETVAQLFLNTADLLQQRQEADAVTPGRMSGDDTESDQGTASANANMQEKMQRQIVKLKEAYSHIQAHTGDSKASAGVSLVV